MNNTDIEELWSLHSNGDGTMDQLGFEEALTTYGNKRYEEGREEAWKAVESLKSPYRPNDTEVYNDVHRECGFQNAKLKALQTLKNT